MPDSHCCGRVILKPGIMWVEFAVGSCPCSEGFPLSSSVFLPPQKPTFQILFQPGESGQEEPPYGMFTAKIQSIPH